MKEKFRSALWLLKSVDQRQKTINKVATSIIQFQKEFLDHGIEHLRPLVLRDVANDIGMHESTVSRVVNNKYMHTPQGVFEMKYFFHSGISSSFGESVSSVTIKQRIRKIIEGEDARKPLSDSKIVSILQKRRPDAGAPDHREVSRGTADSRPRISARSCTEPRRDEGSPMRLALTGRHVDVTPALRQLVTRRLEKLDRLLNDSASPRRSCSTREKRNCITDITLHARGDNVLTGKGAGTTWTQSVSRRGREGEQQAPR